MSFLWSAVICRRSCVARALALVLIAACSAGLAMAAEPLALYVAPDGNDAWSGRLDKPSAEKSDGPFATLIRARDELRKLKQAGNLPDGAVVTLRGGTYRLAAPLELAVEDSGSPAAPVVYRGALGEEVRITGGVEVTGWQPVTDPAVLARLDESVRGKVLQADLRSLAVEDRSPLAPRAEDPSRGARRLRSLGVSVFGEAGGGGLELFFNDQPMTLARWPNEGFVEIVDLVGGHPVDVRGTKGDRVGKFMYEGDRPKRWVQENDPWVHGYWFWDWSDQRQKVESIDTEKRIIAVAPPYHGYGYRKGQWFYAYNLLAEIDEPGEWYLDRQAGTLYFLPPSSMDGARSVVSVLPSLVTIRDASHITIEGLIFEAARATAVTVRGGTHVRIGRCTLRNLGAWAVQASGGTAHTVADCEIYGTGQGGISLSGGDRRTLTPAGHTAENNHVHHYSRWNRMYHPAVALEGVGNRAAHNLIHDAPHEAITFGGNDHVIELNEIHHVCEESNDAGAIYAGRDWTMRGTVIRHNFLHHISGFRGRGCVGVYLDDMFSGTVVSGNVFYQVTRAAFIGGGRDCDVTNNLFVDCTPALHIDARAMGWAADSVPGVMKERLDAMPYRQPPWSERYPKLLNTWEDEPAAPKGNRVARNACFGGRWDEVEARARPYVTFADNWVGDDGGFIDAANMNFQLRDDSPVYHHIPGFEKVPFAEMGLLRSRSAGASRWEAKIRQFEAHDRQEPPPKDGILFLGSSSIVLWDLEKSFPGLPAINRGFGGSQIADSVQFADRIALPYRPKVIVFYAGDNDIAAGKSPEQVAADYRALVRKVRAALPETRIVYIAIKPSIARWKLVEKMREANRLIRAVVAEDPRQVFVDVEPAMLGPDGKPRPELFRSDGLHLSAAGYELWSDQVRPHLGL